MKIDLESSERKSGALGEQLSWQMQKHVQAAAAATLQPPRERRELNNY